MKFKRPFMLVALLLVAGGLAWVLFKEPAETPPIIVPVATCAHPQAQDQDDMCIWTCRTNPAASVVVASDKKAGVLLTYDLLGHPLQVLPAKHPGNIDTRHDFSLGGQLVDLVACNVRDDNKIFLYRMHSATRQLERIDDDAILTGENYGSALYHRRENGRFYVIITSKGGVLEQYELRENGAGRIGGRKVRDWRIGMCEGIVADDATGVIYVAEESKGVWAFDGDPARAPNGRLIIKNGEHGIGGDVEGLALRQPEGRPGCLILSNQGRSNFKVFRTAGTNEFVGTFAVQGARETDGIEVFAGNLGGAFAEGLFACHTGIGRCPVLLCRWADIQKALGL
jgi:3-phytase